MHVYGSTVSPFVQRVLMTARAKGHELDVRFPPGEGGMKSAAFRAISPMGRIPVLALDDGAHLRESDAIASYLDETLDGPSLAPGDALARARIREIIAISALEVATGFRPLLLQKVFGMGDSSDIVAAATGQAEAGLDALDQLLDADGPYALGIAITAADCALAPMLTLAQIVEAKTGMWTLVAARPNVRRYFERVAAEPVPARSITEMREGFAAMLSRNA